MSDADALPADRRDRSLWVTLEGDIDVSVAPALEARLRGAIDQDIDRLVLDLSAVTFIDSSGLRTVLVLADRLRERRRSLVLIVPETGIVRRVVSVSGLDVVVPVVASAGEVPGIAVPSDLPYPT